MRPFPAFPNQSFDRSIQPLSPEPTLSALEAVDDATLLHLLLQRELHTPFVDRLASDLLERFGSLGDIAAADISELARVPGASPSVIMALKLHREFSIRLARRSACRRPVLSSSQALQTYVVTSLAHLPREQFRALYLDRRNILLRDEMVADGTAITLPCIRGKSFAGRLSFRPRP